MKNLKVYENNCKEEVLSGIQIQKTHSNYSLGKTLFATSDIGKYRDRQEDSVLILNHPEIPEFKLIAVSDGVGGLTDGHLASNQIVKNIIYWFEGLNKDLYKNPNKLKESLNVLISNILSNKDIHPWAAATLSLAAICEKETLIANVGDSRIYTCKDGILTQQTKDDTTTQKVYDMYNIYPEELKRFHIDNNLLTMAITNYPEEYEAKYNIINNDYDMIYALTDGISDTLSKKDMENIIKTSKNEEITSKMVQNALSNESYLKEAINSLSDEEKESIKDIEDLIQDEFNKHIAGGKDNSTVAVYIRK